MNSVKKVCTFQWFIENYSYCWHKCEEYLVSPKFTADGPKSSVWDLWLYPRGDRDEFEDKISLYLNRDKTNLDPENFPMKFNLSVISSDGLVLSAEEYEHIFEGEDGCGTSCFLSRRKVAFLPRDTLIVHCTIWRHEGDTQQVKQISARTCIGIEQISFLHVVECFSTLKPNEKKTIEITSSLEKGPSLSNSLYVSGDSCCEGKIIVEIIPTSTTKILSRCRLSFLDASGKKIEFVESDNRFDNTRRDIQKFPFALTKQTILKKKTEYLHGDKLSLLCECIFSSGIKYENVEGILHEMPSFAIKLINDNDLKKDKKYFSGKLSACSSALDDFKTIYDNQLLTDVVLKRKTKSFPAHKLVLCARSSVFKAMLTSDMKEKNTGTIQVDDLEDDTVQQLLHFLYSDKLENLKWESAFELYYIADKYAIEKLKILCSSFLVDNLSVSTASELLLLADTHTDSDLKKTVENFILKHEEEIFGSHEWGKLMETNPLLVSKTMRLKYIGKSDVPSREMKY